MTSPQQLEVSRVIHADRARVFAAWTDPTKIVICWGAGGVRCTEAEVDLRVGGRYRFANTTPDGLTMWITGTFDRVEPPSELGFTWAMEPITDDTQYSHVVVSFTDASDGTKVTIVQTEIPSPEARQIHLEGWIGCLDGLDALLATTS
jgi:uncharacterized protein YndB with AHSA1/START domain